MSGPLNGVRVIEFAGIGPGPFAAMMLSDMGADVIILERPDRAEDDHIVPRTDLLKRGRRSMVIDLKEPRGLAIAERLVDRSDVLIEGFRPGVMERLRLSPDECLARNPRLVYGRATGWGQDGPDAMAAGHDINYIALSGALSLFGRSGGAPVPPMNLLGDFGGGGMLLAFGVVCALLETRDSGRGQVVDAAIVDGSALLTTFVHSFVASGQWTLERGANLFDTGAHFYEVYETADHEYVAIGALEPKFYAELIVRLGLDPDDQPDPTDRSAWRAMKERFAALFRSRTRAEWCDLLGGTDACFAPVLSVTEAPDHPHNRARGTFAEVAGVTQPAAAPRFSRTAPHIAGPPPRLGAHGEAILLELGYAAEEVGALRAGGIVG